MSNIFVSVKLPKVKSSSTGSVITSLKIISEPGYNFIILGEDKCDQLMLFLNISWTEHEKLLDGEVITRSLTELEWDFIKKRI
jgi:hypothetical protein